MQCKRQDCTGLCGRDFLPLIFLAELTNLEPVECWYAEVDSNMASFSQWYLNESSDVKRIPVSPQIKTIWIRDTDGLEP